MQHLNKINRCTKRDLQICHFQDYDLIYAFYSKFPSWGYPEELCTFTATTYYSFSFSSHLPPFYTYFQNFISITFLGCNCSNTMQYCGKLYSFHTCEIIATSVLMSSFIQIVILFHSLILYIFGLRLFLLMSSSNYFKLRCHQKAHFCIPIHTCKLQRKIQSEICINTGCATWCHLPCSSLFHNRMTISPLLFSFNDFTSPLILFSWWRNKISWEWL